MVKTSITTGSVLILLGLIAYFGSSDNFAALIPSFLGILILLLGVIARKEKFLKHAMHASTVLALIGLVISVMESLPALLGDKKLQNPNAVAVQIIISLVCLLFIILAIKSFVDARKNKES